MKKIITIILSLMAVTALFFVLSASSCNTNFEGTYKFQSRTWSGNSITVNEGGYTEDFFVLVLNEDGTYKISSDKQAFNETGNWESEGKNLTLNTEIVSEYGYILIVSYTGKLKGSELTLTYKDGDAVTKLIKK